MKTRQRWVSVSSHDVKFVVYVGADAKDISRRYGATWDRAQAAQWIWQLIDEGHFIRLEREELANGSIRMEHRALEPVKALAMIRAAFKHDVDG